MSKSESELAFLHGFLGSARDWDPIVRGLKSPVEKHVFDLQPADSWQARIRSLAKKINTETIVVGDSMGASGLL